MKKVPIILKKLSNIRDVVRVVSTFDCEVDLTDGRHNVDAKSVTGVFSLDLKKPLYLCIYDDVYVEIILESIKFALL